MNVWIIGLFLFLRTLHLSTSIERDSHSVKITSQDDDVITIQNKTHILCATNNTASPIYLSPPTIQAPVSPSKLLGNLVEVDGWNLKTLEDSLHEPVIDKRWEDFETRYDKFLNYAFEKSFAFSTYNLSSDIEIFVEEEDAMELYTLPPKIGKLWSHFSLLKENSVFTIKRDYEWVGTVTYFRPTKITIRTEHETYFKIHNYTYLYSDQPSHTPTEVPLYSGIPCLVVYVSMCPNCSLELEDHNFPYKEGWQEKQINIDPLQKTIHISKKIDENDTKNPYWEIDLRECPKNENGLVLYETLISDETQKNMRSQCFTLNNRQENNGYLSDAPQFSNCNIGLLGKNCTINCGDLMGEQNKYCQQSRICDNGMCFCSWGYNGLFCDEECSKDKWGINCQNTCSDNCDQCDRYTGKCVIDSTTELEFDFNKEEDLSITPLSEKMYTKVPNNENTNLSSVKTSYLSIGIMTGGFLFITFVMVAGIIFAWRKCSTQRKLKGNYSANINICNRKREITPSEKELI